MKTLYLQQELEAALAELPVLDAHTHLVGGRLGARGLHDVMLYHMLVSDLYAAGCPSGARLTQYPGWPSQKEAHQRIQEALPFLPFIRNTSMAWGLRLILRDLYDWTAPITADNWRELDATIRERADDRAWHHTILDRLNIQRTVTEIARRGRGEDDDRLQYALEWGFFTRCQWGEFDTALYELERCWGRAPESPSPIGSGNRPATERTIRSLQDVKDAVDHYVEAIPYDQVLATATHISTDIDFRLISNGEMEAALARRAQAGPRERDVYASYVNEVFLSELEKRGDRIVYQFSFAAEPLPFETSSRVSQRTIAQLADMVGRHPRLQFQCFLGSRHANQSLCTLARQLPNLSLAGYWWHNFFPDAMRQVMAERLEMLPINKQIGFFSDAYCVEWTCGKLLLVRKLLSGVLADKMALGQYTFGEAVEMARGILFDTPQTLLNITPRQRREERPRQRQEEAQCGHQARGVAAAKSALGSAALGDNHNIATLKQA
jgi:glucuronate isomerase